MTYHHKTDILQLGIWKSSEPMGELEQLAGLSESKSCWCKALKRIEKKRIPERTRIAAQHATASSLVIQYDENGKPYLDNMLSLSISHAGLCLRFVLSCPMFGWIWKPFVLRLKRSHKIYLNEEEAKIHR
ncbi:MAG: hypothetical protein IPJ66_14985 [Bacteroidetes bacterium]|nr:hypothetical protein [Bacteroidota bacterium]